jgi:hypothetical protein
MFWLGSHNKYKFFTLSTGIGLGIELDKRVRCYTTPGDITSVTEDNCDELHISLNDDATEIADLHDSFHPIVLTGRVSLGVVFE